MIKFPAGRNIHERRAEGYCAKKRPRHDNRKELT